MRVCPGCGAESAAAGKFCGHCGTTLDEVVSAPVIPPVVIAPPAPVTPAVPRPATTDDEIPLGERDRLDAAALADLVAAWAAADRAAQTVGAVRQIVARLGTGSAEPVDDEPDSEPTQAQLDTLLNRIEQETAAIAAVEKRIAEKELEIKRLQRQKLVFAAVVVGVVLLLVVVLIAALG